MKARRGHRDLLPLILILGTRGRLLVNCTLKPLYPVK
jgi:hypothetical protein